MKYRIADTPNEPRYRSRFVLTASGYYGDLDRPFDLETDVGADPVDLEWLLDGYRCLKALVAVQDKTDCNARRREFSHPGADLVPCDEYGEWYPHVDEFALTCWCSRGLPYDVEVDDEG